MTERQKRFADEYLIDLNATRAAIRAGYSSKTAYSTGPRLTKTRPVREYIKKRMAEKEEEAIAHQDEILRYLTAVMRGQTTAQVVVIEHTGSSKSRARQIQKMPDEKERLRAAELLGRRYGLFTDCLEISGAASIEIIDDIGELEDD